MQLLLIKVLIAVFLASGVIGWSYHEGYQSHKKKVEAELQKQREAALKVEREWGRAYAKLADVKNAEVERINSRYRDSLNELRKRPARSDPPPASAPAKCAGATGAELYREDGAFLKWEATRAELQRAELAACYAREDEAYRRSKGPE